MQFQKVLVAWSLTCAIAGALNLHQAIGEDSELNRDEQCGEKWPFLYTDKYITNSFTKVLHAEYQNVLEHIRETKEARLHKCEDHTELAEQSACKRAVEAECAEATRTAEATRQKQNANALNTHRFSAKQPVLYIGERQFVTTKHNPWAFDGSQILNVPSYSWGVNAAWIMGAVVKGNPVILEVPRVHEEKRRDMTFQGEITLKEEGAHPFNWFDLQRLKRFMGTGRPTPKTWKEYCSTAGGGMFYFNKPGEKERLTITCMEVSVLMHSCYEFEKITDEQLIFMPLTEEKNALLPTPCTKKGMEQEDEEDYAHYHQPGGNWAHLPPRSDLKTWKPTEWRHHGHHGHHGHPIDHGK